MNAALFSIDSFGGLTFSSTFTAGTFQLTNNSDTQDIVSITLDLRDAIFPDLVFDPNGEAGDSTARGFQFDSQNDAGNTIEITNFPFANAAAPFSSPHDGGFDVLTINFDRFEPGQTLRFSTDVDPTSIKGSNDPGPSDSGSISGLELVGATITVTFADDTELTGQVYRTPNSDSGSEVSLTPTTTAAPEISAIGFDAAATVGDANQTIRVEGNAGAEVSLLVLEGAFYTEANGGFDADPFEANTAIAVSEITATIGANGSVDVPVNLTRTDAADGGLNYIVAKYQDGNSLVSDRLVLEYAPGTTNPDPNPNTPAGTIRIQAEDYNAGTNGEEYFDFDADVNLGGAYRPNEGVDIEAASDVGGGFNVAFIQDGEFLTYDVNVPEAGTYNVMLRVATPSEDTQTAEVTINGQTYTASFDFTGGWQEYTDVLVTNVSLAAGTQEIRFDARSSMFNFNYIDLVAAEPGDIVDTAVPTAVLNTTALTKQVDGVAPANFTITYSDDQGINNNTIDANDVTVTAPDGTEIPVTLVEVDRPGNGSPITATYAIAAPGGSWDGAEAGDYTIALGAGEVSDVNGKNAAAGVLGTLSLFVAGDGGETPTNPNPNPNPEVPAGTIRIEAEDYKAGTNGTEYFDFDAENLGGAIRLTEPVDIQDADDVGGGYNVAFIQDGEFLTYDVNVAEAGTYDVVLRVATPSADTQTAEVTINGQTYTASFDFTGGWQEYTDVLVTNVNLAAGTQELRIDARSSMFNFNYIDIVAAEPGENTDSIAPTAVLNTTTSTKQFNGVAPANFTVTYSDDNAIAGNTIDANDLTVTAPDGTEMAAELVSVDNPGNGSPITATYAIAVPGGTWDATDAGDYTISLKAGEISDVNGNNAAAGVLGTLSLFVAGDDGDNPTTNPNPNPNPEVPAGTIRIEAEDYKAGTNGTEYFDFDVENLGGAIRLTEPVDIQDADDIGGGYNVAFIQDGEFLTYDVNVAQAGNYDVVLRVATPSADTQTAEVTINGQTYTASFDFTGGWQEYIDVLVTNVELEAGIQELRIDARSSEFNFNYIDLVGAEQIVDEVAPTAVLNTTSLTKQADGVSPANFTVTYSDNNAIAANTIDANDVTVTAPDGTEIAVELVSVDTPGNGSPITATYAIAVPGGTWDATDAGDYTINLKEGEVSDPNGNSVAAGDLGTLNLFVAGVEEPPVTPPVTPPSVGNSIRIEAEDYRAGINGIDYLDTSRHNFGGAYRNDNVDIEASGDVDGGFNVGWIQAGEFLIYDIDVPQVGTYDVVLRVASPADNQSLDIVVGGETTRAEFGFTGGWQTYEDVVISGVNLEAGNQELRLNMKSNSFNLNYFELVPRTLVEVDTTEPTATLDTTVLTQQSDSEAAANFTITYSDNVAIDAATINANDVTVTAPDGTELAVTLVSVDPAGDGTPRTATYAIAAPGGTWDSTEAGDYTVSLKAEQVNDTSDNAAAAAVLGSFSLFIADDGGGTNPGTIRIEAEDYKAGTNGTEYFDFDADVNLGGTYRLEEGVDIETTGDVEGGFNVAFIQDGEFLTYDVDVVEAGTYNVVLRVATPSEDTQSAEVTINGKTYTTAFGFTGGWQEYTDVLVTNVELAAGTQELRIDARSSLFNFNYIELVAAEPGAVDSIAPTAVLDTTSLTKQPNGIAPANFTLTFSDDVGINVNTIDNGDVTVTAPDGTELAATLVSVDANTNGTPRSAVYNINAPGGAWDATDAGSYTVSLNAGEVADTSGNSATAGVVGSFDINVAPTPDDNAIRINAGATADIVDANNKLWLADVDFTGGQASTVDNAIDNTVDDFIYQSQRAGDNFSYSIPVEDGNYQVNLYLAELDFDNSGQRQFDVALEGDNVLDNYDIWRDTKNAFLNGSDTAKVVQISDLSVIRDGAIDLDFTSVANNATIAGIEIVPIEGAQVFIIESDDSTLVTEGGNSDTYQVLLNSQPTANVTINLQPDNQSSVNQNTLIFTPQNWSVPQTVTVNAVDDNSAESFSHGSAIAHTISTTDPAYSNINVPNLNLQVIDNDAADAEIKFDIKDLGINIGGKTTGTWGPDGRLYVGTADQFNGNGGKIAAYTFDDNYNITDTEIITTIEGLSSDDILGIAFNPFENDGSELKLYVSHSELYANEYTYTKNGGSGFNELVDFSPYSGEVSVLSGADFSEREIVVDNLGVSNHDHGINGLAFDGNGDLLIAVGSNTNAGIPDDEIGGLDESPFTAAIIKAEITKPDFNGNIQYQLPADWVAPEGLQVDPLASQGFGGIVDVAPGVDVSIYASGLRNSYDLVYSTKGILYATENDANSGFGDYSTSATTQEPFNLDPQNEINIVEEGNYYGNPNRNRGRQDDRQNAYYPSYDSSNGEYTAPIRQHPQHIHGITEYRSTTFSEQLRGDLLTIELDSNGGTVQNVVLSDDGREVENMVGLKTQTNGGEGLTQGLDVVTGFGGSIIGINYFGDVTAAIPVTDNVTTATAYEIDEWRAPASGGGTFTIGGVNFSELGDTTVTIGNEVATIESVSDKRIFGTLPAFDVNEYANQGLLDITVNSGGEVSTITDAFLPLFV